MESNFYLIWLEWPEKCFRVDAKALRLLRDLVPAGSRIVRARSESAFLRALPQATHAVVWQFKSDWFARAPRLKILATPAAGREFVPERGPKGVRIHFGAFHGPLMAETVAAFLLAWCRGLLRLRSPEVADDPWPRTWLSDKCSRLAGTNAAVVGFGHVGRAIGLLLERLGVNVTGVTRHGIFRGARRPQRLAAATEREILRSADWLVLALPSTTGTDDWLDAARLRLLPRRCVVVNVGRGNSVDERALFAALKAGRLAAACLDVRKHEPSASVLEADGFVAELADLPNCFSLPHAAAFDASYVNRCFLELKNDGCL